MFRDQSESHVSGRKIEMLKLPPASIKTSVAGVIGGDGGGTLWHLAGRDGVTGSNEVDSRIK